MPIPKLLVTAGMMAANLALTMTKKIEGPRLDDLKFSGGDYGTALPMVWGMRRLPGSIFWAEDLKEVKRRRKTKGGKFNDYSYFGTWAFAVAGHEIQAIRRIWFDKHLVFDLTGEGPVTPFQFYAADSGGGKPLGGALFGALGLAYSSGDQGQWITNDWFSIFLGTETQEPDPRMQATVEAEFGEGSCPAYRGTAYVVVKDLPLEKFGNRIPQIEVEVVGSAAGVWPTESLTLAQPTSHLEFNHDFSVMAVGSAAGFNLIDVAARASYGGAAFDPALDSSSFALQGDGTVLGLVGLSGQDIYRFPVSGIGSLFFATAASLSVMTVTDANGVEHWFAQNLLGGDDSYFDGAAVDLEAATGTAWDGKFLFADSAGAVWLCGGDSSQTTAHFYRIYGTGTGPGYFTVTGLPTFGSRFGACYFSNAGTDQYIFGWNGDLYAVDSTGTVLASNTTVATAPGIDGFQAMRVGRRTIWAGLEEVSLADLTVVRTELASNWGLISVGGTVYDPVNHALLTRPSGTILRWLYLDRVGSDGVTLGSIAGDLADWCGVTDHDFSDLDQTVYGYSATQGAAESILEPLLDAYDADIRPHEFTVQGIKRHGVPSGAVLPTRMMLADSQRSAKVLEGKGIGAAVTISFADIDADQQPNNVRAARPLDATGATGESTIDLTTLVLGPDLAGQLVRRYFRRRWNERREFSFGLTHQELALEPGDVRQFELDGQTITGRCIEATVGIGGIETVWKYDNASLALTDSDAGAAFDGRNPDVIAIPLLSQGFVLDAPYLSDADDQTTPIVYIAAAPLATGGWPGATVYQETGGEYSDEIGSVASGSGATWGYAGDVLADANPNIWDRGNSVNVTLQTGTLTGCTEADIDANPLLNLCLIGAELVNFTVATLEGDGSYTLSGFKRGRRGTEWACADHAAGETFLLLDTAQDVAMGLSEVGTNLSFKAITSGRTTGFPIDLEPFSGASLKPYAPCNLTETKESSGDWTLGWTRRTRIGGAWTSGTSIPLSESSEEYEVEILNGSTVVRTITALSSPTATYTDAQQVTDFGSTQATLSWRVYQISAQVDRGFAAAA